MTNDHVPAAWAQTTLADIRLDQSTNVDPRKTPNDRFELYSVPAFPTKEPEIVFGREIGSSKKAVSPDTVLVCRINPRINRIWRVGHHSDFTKIASTEWIPFFPLNGLDPDYVCYFLGTNAFRDFLATKASGVGGSLMRVNPVTLSSYSFLMPPLPEQHRIVAKIEELFSDLDAGVETLKKLRALIKRYRQSVLKAAFEGKLTEEWRQQHKDELEPASILLERIREERKKKAKEEGKKYKEPAPVDTTDLPELPEGWVNVSLGGICELVEKVKPDDSPEEGFTYLDIASIDNTCHRITAPKTYVGKNAPSRARQRVRSGDVLFSTVRTYLKNIATVPPEFDGEIASTGFCVIRPWEGLDSRFYFHFVLADRFVNPLSKIQRGTSYPAVRDSDVFEQIVPLPPLNEQKQIASAIDQRLSAPDKLDKLLDESHRQSQGLRQSILKRAFEGKLVPQDPNDEPAEKLLERIKAEKAKLDAEKRHGKRRRIKGLDGGSTAKRRQK